MNYSADNWAKKNTWPTEIHQQVWDGVPDAIILVDDHGQIIFVNEKVKKLFGYSTTELIGYPIEKLIPGRFFKHQDLRAKYMQSPHEREQSSLSGIFCLKKDGNEFPADVHLKSIVTDQQSLIVTFVRDLTNIISIKEEKKITGATISISKNTYTWPIH